jgi:hypothetical protein
VRSRSNTTRSTFVGLGVAIALVLVGLAAAGALESRPTRTHALNLQISVPPVEVRCEHAYTSFAGIAAKYPNEALVPNSSLASSQNLTFVTWCPEPATIQVYASGVWITVRPSNMTDPVKTFAQTVAQNAGVTATTINGDPAIQADPSQDPNGNLPGGVEFVHQGIDIGVFGNGKIALADLLIVAKSVASYHELTPSPLGGPSASPTV